MARALKKGAPIALLVFVDHPSGAFFAWTGIGQLLYQNALYVGVGKLGSITPIKHTTDLTIQTLVMQISGLPPDTVTWLESSIQGRSATIDLAAFDERGNVIPTPYRLNEPLLDFQSLQIGKDGSAVISISCQSGFYTLERAVSEAWTSQDQKRLFPNDVGLDLISTLIMKDITWTQT